MLPIDELSGQDGHLFRALFVRHIMDAMMLMSEGGDILLSNAAASTLFGYTAEELTEGGWRLLIDEQHLQISLFASARAERGAVRGEAWLDRKDGSRFRAELTCTRLDEKGPSHIVVVIRDVTERYRLEYQQRLVTTAMNDSPQVICVIDADWTILWANRATCRVSGYAEEQLIGNPAPMARYLEAEDPETLRAINRSLASTGQWSGEVFTRRRNGEVYPLFGVFSRVESPEPGQFHYITTLSDVSTIRANERKLHAITHFDPVTGLANRRYFLDLASVALRQARRNDGLSAYVFVCDVDRFRDVIESHGFRVADQVLRILGDRLTETLGPNSLLARHSGDTFIGMLCDAQGKPQAETLAAHLLDVSRQPIVVGDIELVLSLSMGIGCYPADGNTVEALLRSAQMAMDRIKEDGGGSTGFYDASAAHANAKNLKIATALRRAIENNALIAYYQPIVDSSTLDVVGMEALVRWVCADGVVVSPGQFLDAAERAGLIGLISDSVLRQACQHLLKLDWAGHPGLHCSVNLSVSQFRDSALPERIIDILESEGLAPERLTLEITESLLMDKPREKRAMLAVLQDRGVRIVIDDFGTGYSSFGYLKHFSVDGIKLDRMFLEDIPGDVKDERLVAMLLSIGRELDIPVVAEGVETRDQARFLRHHCCTRLQGFYIAPALASDTFMKFLQHEQSMGENVARIY